MKKGISILICNSNEFYYNHLDYLRGKDVVFFNVLTEYSLETNTYFKNKKIAKMKGICKIIARIFYRFVPDVPIKMELKTSSLSSNKCFMCIKDIIIDPLKKYVVGLAGFDISSIEEILNYFLKEKKGYNILIICIDYSLGKENHYEELTDDNIECIIRYLS